MVFLLLYYYSVIVAAPARFWMKDGKLVVNAEGKPIACATCPCDIDPCSVCCIPSVHVKVTARTYIFAWDDPDHIDTVTTSHSVYDHTEVVEGDMPMFTSVPYNALPNCLYTNSTVYVYCDPDTTQNTDPEAAGYCNSMGFYFYYTYADCDPETTQSEDPEAPNYCDPDAITGTVTGPGFDTANYSPLLEAPSGIFLFLNVFLSCGVTPGGSPPDGATTCFTNGGGVFVFRTLNWDASAPIVAEVPFHGFALPDGGSRYFGYWGGAFHPLYCSLSFQCDWGEGFYGIAGARAWQTLPFGPTLTPAEINSVFTEYLVEIYPTP